VGPAVNNGKPVEWVELSRYSREVERRWTAFVELANVAQSGDNRSLSGKLGVGVGYRLFSVADIDITPSTVVSTSLDWVAPELRLSRRVWSGVSVGAGVGYRVGLDEGLHLGISIGIEL